MLPGLAPSVVIGAAAGPTSFTFVNSASGSDASVEIPSGAQAGDICLIFNGAYSTGTGAVAPSDTTPAGFTKLRTATTSTIRASIFVKKLDGTETSVTGLSASTATPFMNWVAVVLRPNAPVTSIIDNSTGNNEITSADPASQTIAATGAAAPVILFGHMFAGAAITTRTTSPTMTEIAGASTQHYAHYRIYNASDTPVNHSYDMVDNGTQALQSGFLTFT